MGEKTRNNNSQEDELNQARFFAERGADVGDVEEPDADGIEIEEEDIADTKSEYREMPAIRHESKIADQSPYFGQGFNDPDDSGIRRGASKDGEEPDVES